MTAILPGGDIFLEPTSKVSARRALLRLLTRHPNRIVTHAEVEAEAGREFSRVAVSKAATTLRRDIALRTRRGHGGGYVLLIPSDAALYLVGENRYEMRTCADCAHHTALGHCRELDMETDKGLWCWGWTAR